MTPRDLCSKRVSAVFWEFGLGAPREQQVLFSQVGVETQRLTNEPAVSGHQSPSAGHMTQPLSGAAGEGFQASTLHQRACFVLAAEFLIDIRIRA